ncbi:MAG TPA: isochorismatase family protein [Xanthobacteraceae bacterium]|nr:isochorismatase family protein [Xanthobacteraceae bacterium]
MSSIIELHSYRDLPEPPTLVLVDMQRENLASSRMLSIPDTMAAIANCRLALGHARANGFPVAFVRWIARPADEALPPVLPKWIEGFEPTGADMVFDREKPSCYASRPFGSVISDNGGRFVLAGFSGEAACLSTAVDAFHRGHRMQYLADASASHALDDMSASDIHRTVSRIVDIYADTIPTRTWLALSSRRSNLRSIRYERFRHEQA